MRADFETLDRTPTLVLTGRLEAVRLADVLQLLAGGSRDGELTVERDVPPERATIELLRGRVVHAVHSAHAEPLGEVLLRHRAVEAARLGEALARQSAAAQWRPLGSVLLEMRAVEPGRLARALEEQIEATIARAMTWDAGVFRFRTRGDGPSLAADAARVQLDAHELLLAAARRADESATSH